MYNNSLIFKTIEAEAAQSGLRITSIFETINTELDALRKQSDIGTISFSTTLESDKKALQEFTNARETISEAEALAKFMKDASASAREYAIDNKDITAESIEEFIAQQKMAEIATVAQSKSLVNARSIINTYNTDVQKLNLTNQQYIDSVNNGNKGLGNYLSTVDNGEATMRGYIKSLVASKAATIGMQAATMALNMALSWGISALMSFAFTAIDNIIHREEKLIEKSEDAANAISSISSDFKSKSDTVKDIGKEFAELAQGVDALTGANKSLSTEDYERFLSLSNQLAETFPTLSRNYDENGNAIVNLNGNVNTITDSLNALLDVERQLANQKIVDNLPDLYDGVKTKAGNYKSEIQ